MSRNRTDFIAVHCADTKPNMDIGVDEIRQWHTAPVSKGGRGWQDIGYNFVIKRDGTVQNGRDLDKDGDVFEEIGAHVAGFNGRSIGVCLVGGMSYTGKPENNFTKEQFDALEKLLYVLTRRYPGVKVYGHRDFPGVSKQCPCFDVQAWWKKIDGDF